VMNSRRLIIRLEAEDNGRVIAQTSTLEGADLPQCPLWVKSRHVQCKTHVRFTPNSDRESGFPQTVMSALPRKADMYGALADVRFGPIADIPGA
jgi:hypothetical protein